MAWSDIPGRAAYLWLYDEWIASKPRDNAIVVEVGVALGKSIAYLVDALEKANRPDVRVYGVDHWGGYSMNGEQQSMRDAVGGCFSLYATQMMQHAGRAFERVRVLREQSVVASTMFAPGSVDLCVLDADHTYESVANDIEAWLPVSKWMGGDDLMPEFPGVEKAVREVFVDIEVRHDCGWGTWLWRGTR